jgi:glycerate kinase
MRILIACDSFKDALPAAQVCAAVAAGLDGRADAAMAFPLADGGEGTFDVLAAHLGLQTVEVAVADPLMRPITAPYGLSADGAVAVVEMAKASGLQLLAAAERDPLAATSYGTGQLLADARARGARRIVLAIGGSATNDGGVGAAAALGWRFLDAAGRPVEPRGGRLGDIAAIAPPAGPILKGLEVMCDVTNPLFGPAGASWTYGRQKGGDDRSLARLDADLERLAGLVADQLGRRGLAEMPGAGAAGGLGFGALAFMDGTLKRGIDLVLDVTGFDQALAGADLVVTGEGHLDGQTLNGKLIEGVCARAGAKGVPVIALCGKLSASSDQIRAIGLKAAYSINPVERPLAQMLAQTADNLRRTAASMPLL